MAIKLLLILALAILAQPYTIENQVLILTDEDLPGVTKEFEYILIEFYAPWYPSPQQGADTAKNYPPSTTKSPRNSTSQDLQVK